MKMNDLKFLSIFFIKANIFSFFPHSFVHSFLPSFCPAILPSAFPPFLPFRQFETITRVSQVCMHLHFLSGRPQKIYMGVYGKERMLCTSPDFYWPFLCMVLKQCFDLINDNSAEAKDGVLLSFDICLWFAVGFMTSLHSFMLEFTDSDSCCRGNIENIFFFPCHNVFSNSCLLFFCPFFGFNIFHKCYHLLGCLVLHVVNRANSFGGAGMVLFTAAHNEDCCLCLGQVGWVLHRNAEHVLVSSYLLFSFFNLE